jgi:tetratricopeptide (TPR) repeat protein
LLVFGLFGRKPSPEQVRAELFAARSSELAELCQRHKDVIRKHFPEWQRVPVEIRADPEMLRVYGRRLMEIADVFFEHLGNDALMRAMSVQDASFLARAVGLMQQGDYGSALELLERESTSPLVLGKMGECHFQLGRPEEARELTMQALEQCRLASDGEGVRAYLGNLYEIDRYRGQGARAAKWAEQLAYEYTSLGQTALAERMRRRARVAPNEPLSRVVAVTDEGTFELDEPFFERSVQFAFERNRVTLQPCRALVEEGKELGGRGDLEGALRCFQAASKRDAFDPDCHYQAGLTLLYMGRFEDAVAEYELTETLAPGWFHCRYDGWVARKLASGDMDEAMFGLLVELEDGPGTPEEKYGMCSSALEDFPSLAPLWFHQGSSLVGMGRASDAVESFRKGLECVEEPDLKTRLLLGLGHTMNPGPMPVQYLHEAVKLDGNRVAAAMARVLLRSLEPG